MQTIIDALVKEGAKEDDAKQFVMEVADALNQELIIRIIQMVQGLLINGETDEKILDVLKESGLPDDQATILLDRIKEARPVDDGECAPEGEGAPEAESPAGEAQKEE